MSFDNPTKKKWKSRSNGPDWIHSVWARKPSSAHFVDRLFLKNQDDQARENLTITVACSQSAFTDRDDHARENLTIKLEKISRSPSLALVYRRNLRFFWTTVISFVFTCSIKNIGSVRIIYRGILGVWPRFWFSDFVCCDSKILWLFGFI